MIVSNGSHDVIASLLNEAESSISSAEDDYLAGDVSICFKKICKAVGAMSDALDIMVDKLIY